MFSLTVKSTRGDTTHVDVSPTMTVAELKAELRRTGAIPPEAVRAHVAHHGRLLGEDEMLDIVADAPVVILACITAVAEAAAAPVEPGDAAAAGVPQTIAAAWAAAFPAGARALLPRGVNAAWDRAFPGAAAPAPAQEEEEDEPVCRICFCGDETGENLISPCLCSGSMKWVHASCLDEWRASSANARSFHRCDQCGAQYRLQRSPYAPLLESEAVCLAASALLLAALVGVCALVPGRPERLLYRLGEWHPAVWYRWWRPWMDRSVRGVALPGAFGFALSVREQLILHRGIPLTQQGWLSALVLTVATNGARIARVFVACGIVYFWAQLAARIRAEARRALTKLTRVLDRNVVVPR